MFPFSSYKQALKQKMVHVCLWVLCPSSHVSTDRSLGLWWTVTVLPSVTWYRQDVPTHSQHHIHGIRLFHDHEFCLRSVLLSIRYSLDLVKTERKKKTSDKIHGCRQGGGGVRWSAVATPDRSSPKRREDLKSSFKFLHSFHKLSSTLSFKQRK